MPTTTSSGPRDGVMPSWRRSSQNASQFIRSLFRRGSAQRSPSSSYQTMPCQLNEDILHHILSYLSLETLKEVNAANRVFFAAWMKSRYESLILTKNNKRLLERLSDPDVAKYVKRAVIRPWVINLPVVTSTRLRQTIWNNVNEIIDPAFAVKEAERQLHRHLWKDITLVLRALDAMGNIRDYLIEWNEESHYHPELYKACFAPISQKWTGQLAKLTIKVPPQLLKYLASIHLEHLETLEYYFCTGQMSPQDINEMHNGFIVFVNNLKDSLECISFVSTHTSQTLDMTRIYKSLASFPKLRSISLSIPYDGGHLSDPLAFVEFLEKHRSTLRNISVLSSRLTVHLTPSDPESINWIQKILTSVRSPFPRLRTLALAMRPLRASLTNVSDFLEMHISTLDSLTLADRAFNFRDFERLLKTTNGPLDLQGLRHLRVKVDDFSPSFLFYLATTIPGLTSLDIEYPSNINNRNDCVHDTDFNAFRGEVINNKELLVNWKLQRMAIGPKPKAQDPDWVLYIEDALVECIPNLRIANWHPS